MCNFKKNSSLCSSHSTLEKDNKKNEYVSSKHSTGSVNLQGCGFRILTGGMGMSQFCSEGIVHGCDVGELQQSIVCGKSLCMWKYGKVLDQATQYTVHEHVNIQSKSSKCKECSNVIHESTQSIPYKTNHSDASLQLPNQKRQKPGNTKEVCKYKECINCLNVCSIISLNQGIYMETKVYNRNTEFDNVFVSQHKLRVKRNNSGVKPYKCSKFDKCFTQQSHLSIHQRIHTGEKPYKCSECDKWFAHDVSLRRHQRSHTGEKPNKCSECDKYFTQKYHLSIHQRIHTGKKPYKCSECDKCFIHKVKLRIHERIHTGEKPYKCSECDKCFTHRVSLKIHQRIHTGEKLYKCTDCAKALLKKAV